MELSIGSVEGPLVTINSTSTPSINGEWAVCLERVVLCLSEAASIGVTGAFTSGTTTLSWKDGFSGADVTFPNTTLFIAWAQAYAQYMTALAYYEWGKTTSPPSSTVTIP
jgi:hypothetical protein